MKTTHKGMNPARATGEKLPPLNAIRVFEAVGRLLSFSRAAAELSVTPSAISHQIRSLEDYLGMRLLQRQGSRIQLTSSGQRYLTQVSQGLTVLSHATRSLKTGRGQRLLRITAGASLASLWLLPRLEGFIKAHPEVSVSLQIGAQQPDTVQDQNQVFLWYGKMSAPGWHIDKMCSQAIFPVCSPKLLKDRRLKSAADLRFHALIDCADDLYVDPCNPGWSGWFAGAGIEPVKPASTLYLSPKTLVREAAIAGMGVGLMKPLLAADDLRAGRLVCPFGPAVPIETDNMLAYRESVAARSEVIAFRKWVLAEAKASLKDLRIPPLPDRARAA